MSFEVLAILLFVIGCGLIVAEVFIPSGGMILVLCVVAFLGSLWCAYKAWWGMPWYFGTYIAALVVFIPGILFGIYRLLEDTKVGDRVLLSAPDLEEVTPYQEEEAHLSEFVGRRGSAITRLMPGGLVEFDGERLHAFTEGLMIDQGGVVKVVAVRGTRVVVQPADDYDDFAAQQHRPDNSVEGAFDEDQATPPPLDFDLPQS